MKHILALTAVLLILASVCAEAGQINGQVMFETGGPVAQAMIDFSSGSQRARAVTADDGSYYVSDLPDGVYEVTITYRGQQHTFRRDIPKQGLTFKIAS
jgi:Carboxypeptidase regulatory-like domain